MARGVTIKVKGLDRLLRDLDKLPKQLEAEVDAELETGARMMAMGGKRDAPGDQGYLNSGITSYKAGRLSYVYASQAIYSGYVEFGTRSNVRIPAGLEQYAAEVKAQKTVSSLGAKEAIFQWCKRKGIEQRLWYPIFITLMTKGMKPHPFFFKQLDVYGPKIVKNVQAVIDDLD